MRSPKARAVDLLEVMRTTPVGRTFTVKDGGEGERLMVISAEGSGYSQPCKPCWFYERTRKGRCPYIKTCISANRPDNKSVRYVKAQGKWQKGG